VVYTQQEVPGWCITVLRSRVVYITVLRVPVHLPGTPARVHTACPRKSLHVGSVSSRRYAELSSPAGHLLCPPLTALTSLSDLLREVSPPRYSRSEVRDITKR